jgi:hypothetical protein
MALPPRLTVAVVARRPYAHRQTIRFHQWLGDTLAQAKINRAQWLAAARHR